MMKCETSLRAFDSIVCFQRFSSVSEDFDSAEYMEHVAFISTWLRLVERGNPVVKDEFVTLFSVLPSLFPSGTVPISVEILNVAASEASK